VKRLTFKRDYLPLVASGRKRQTIRRWPAPRLKPGEIVLIPGAGVAEVTSVERVGFDELDETDADLEGFASVEELVKTLKRIYGDVGPFWRVRFRLLPRRVRGKNIGC